MLLFNERELEHIRDLANGEIEDLEQEVEDYDEQITRLQSIVDKVTDQLGR